MRIYKHDYYDRFRCIAGNCPDSCCKDWDVQVDDTSAALYRSLDGALGERLRKVLKDDPEAGTLMTIENRRCPMWREDGLCRIQVELGHDALCKTCRDFPRLSHDYGDFAELQLELSCPEAARLILSAAETPMTEEEIPGGEDPNYSLLDMELLLQTRQQALKLLASPRPANEVLAQLLVYGYHAQFMLDNGEHTTFEPNDALEMAYNMAKPGDMQAILDFYSTLEILSPDWAERLRAPQKRTWDAPYKALARYFVERYWLQAISDFDLISRVKFIVISCLTVYLLGGDMIQTAQRYSKEIENNIDNVDALLDAACENAIFTDDKLFGLLLKG